MTNKTKYEIRTKKLQTKLKQLKETYQPLKIHAKTSHHPIKVNNITYTDLRGNIKTFNSAKELTKFITKQQKIIDERLFKTKLRKESKRITKETNKALKALEDNAKELIKQSKKLKGKKQKLKVEQAEDLRRMIKEYKKFRKEDRKGTAGLMIRGKKRGLNKLKQSLEKIVGTKFANENFGRLWGLWELCLGSDGDYKIWRDLIYESAKRGKLSSEDLENLNNLFDEWYRYMHTDPVYADSLRDQIISEINNILNIITERTFKNKDEKPIKDEEQWS